MAAPAQAAQLQTNITRVLYVTCPVIRPQASDLPSFRGRPLYLCGASLGGCIALRATLHRPELFQGLVLLAPMLSLEKVAQAGINWLLRPIGNVISLLAPRSQARHVVVGSAYVACYLLACCSSRCSILQTGCCGPQAMSSAC